MSSPSTKLARTFLTEDLEQYLSTRYPWLLDGGATADATEEWGASKKKRDDIDEIIGAAFQRDETGAVARKALGYLILSSDSRPTMEEQDWIQALVADAIADVCEHDDIARYEMSALIAACLGEYKGLTRQARVSLLKALLSFAETGDAQGNINYFDIGDALAGAIECEIGRANADQDEHYQLQLLTHLRVFRHPSMFPIAEAISKSHPIPRVKQAAQALKLEMKDSVYAMWTATVVDRVSDTEALAQRLRAVLNERLDVTQAIQAVFNATKGRPMESVADPRMRFVHYALEYDNEHMQLAGVRSMLDSGPGLLAYFSQSVETLCNFAVNAKSMSVSADACKFLRELEELHREQASIFEAAKSQANRKFVQRLSGVK